MICIYLSKSARVGEIEGSELQENYVVTDVDAPKPRNVLFNMCQNGTENSKPCGTKN
jgi:hypothetical protein